MFSNFFISSFLFLTFFLKRLSSVVQRFAAAAAAAKLLQSCLTLCDPTDGSPPGSHPWDSPGKNSGVGCHLLLQCMKVKSESEVAQSSLTPGNPMDCSLPGSSTHWIFQARVLEWGAIAFSNIVLSNSVKSEPSTSCFYKNKNVAPL